MRKITTTEERLTLGTKAFRQYLSEIHNYRTLSPDEEYELCVKMVEGDEGARDLVIKHNLRFVVSIAKKYYGNNVSLEDLVNEGNHGLITATKHFDPSRGFKFISYAVWWIRRDILFFLNNKDNIIRVPHHKITLMSKIKEDFMRLEQKLEKQPSPADMKSFYGDVYEDDDVGMFYNLYLGKVKQLDKEITNDGTTTTSIDIMENNIFPNADDALMEGDTPHRMARILQYLNKKQSNVISKHFGLNGQEPVSLDNIGIEMGISKERVRQIKEKSLSILRNKLKLNYIYM
jgi:RNA polymerase primary sigma factor